jgi:hypothetical protein
MTDEKVVAIIAVVLRGETDTLGSCVTSLPPGIEVLQIVHHNEGIVILSRDELTQLRKSFSEAGWATRHKIRRALQAQSHTKAMEKNEKPSTTPREAKAKDDLDEDGGRP